MLEEFNGWLKETFGIDDYDALEDFEKETYRQYLEMFQGSEITLESVKRHIHNMRQSMESRIIEEPEYIHSMPFPFLKRPNPMIPVIKARLKDYLLFEAFFERPDKARELLENLKKRKAIIGKGF